MAAHESSVRKLRFPTMAAFGVGQIGERLRLAGFATFLLLYYQQVIGLRGTQAANAIALAGLFDAFLDPVLGALSDRTKTRWGRRHPFMVLGVIPLAVGFYAVFNPPAGLSVTGLQAWLFGFCLLARIGTSLYHVSHMALGAEMASDYNQRSTLFSFNVFFENIAFAGGSALALRFCFPDTPQYTPGTLNPAGYHSFSLGFSAAMVAAVLLCAWGTRREIPHLPDAVIKRSFGFFQVFRDVGAVFRNKSFRALFLGLVIGAFVVGVELTLQPYIGLHFFGFGTKQLAQVQMIALSGLFLALPLVPFVTRRFDRKPTLIGAALIATFASHILILLKLTVPDLLPPTGSNALLHLYELGYFVFNLMSPIGFATSAAMFADIADEHELETGERREGVIYAARIFSIAMIQTVSTWACGQLLDVIHFPSGAKAGSVAPEVVTKLGLIPMAAATLTLLSVSVYSSYVIDRKRHAEIQAEITKRRAARRAQGSAEAAEIATPTPGRLALDPD